MNYRLKALSKHGAPTLIIGAGSAGEMAVKEMINNDNLSYLPIGFLDDNPDKLGKQMMGISVLGRVSDLNAVIKKYNVEEAIIAIKDYPQQKFHELVHELIKQHIKVKKFNLIEDVNHNRASQLVDLKVEDLLSRPVIDLDDRKIDEFIQGEVVLVTGGGGSIGSDYLDKYTL